MRFSPLCSSPCDFILCSPSSPPSLRHSRSPRTPTGRPFARVQRTVASRQASSKPDVQIRIAARRSAPSNRCAALSRGMNSAFLSHRSSAPRAAQLRRVASSRTEAAHAVTARVARSCAPPILAAAAWRGTKVASISRMRCASVAAPQAHPAARSRMRRLVAATPTAVRPFARLMRTAARVLGIRSASIGQINSAQTAAIPTQGVAATNTQVPTAVTRRAANSFAPRISTAAKIDGTSIALNPQTPTVG